MSSKKIICFLLTLSYSTFVYANANTLKEPISFLTDKKTEKSFWEQDYYNPHQASHQINLILKTINDDYLRYNLKWLSNHLTQKNLAYDNDHSYRIKNFLFNKKRYTAINLVSGASAPVGILYLINNNKINFSEDLGPVISINAFQIGNNRLLVKTRLNGGTGLYSVSGVLLEKDKNRFKKIAVYPIHGFASNPGINLEYRVKEVHSHEVETLKFVETITLLDNTHTARQEFGFTQSLQKEFIVILKKQRNKFIVVNNPSNSNDPAFKVFANSWMELPG